MNCIGLGIILVVTLAVQPRESRADKHCWPGNETDVCFAAIPPDVMPWPTERKGSYVSEEEEVVDLDEYTVSTVQKDPRDFCQYRKEILDAMDCVSRAMADRCPELPTEMMSKRDRLGLAMDNFCKELDNIDPVCMENHWQATMKCHGKMMQQQRPTTTTTREGVEQESDYDDHHEDTDSMPKMDKKTLNRIICGMKYQMMECVRKTMVDCDEKTSEVMAQFMKDMSSQRCASMMEQWHASQEAQGGATSSSGVAWATALTSASVLLALCYCPMNFVA